MGPPVGKLPFQLRPALNLRRQIVRNRLQFPHELSNLQLQVLRQPPRSLYVTVRLLVADAFSSPYYTSLCGQQAGPGWRRVSERIAPCAERLGCLSLPEIEESIHATSRACAGSSAHRAICVPTSLA